MSESQPWGEWIEQHGPALLLYARRFARDSVEAEDLVQEAFIRFWRSREQANDPLTYLFSCVRNVAIDSARSRQSRTAREQRVGLERAGLERVSRADWFETTLDQAELASAVENAVSELPAEQAEVVTLKIWSELTFQQIAKVTGAPAGTVASRYRYALQALKKVLAENAQQSP